MAVRHKTMDCGWIKVYRRLEKWEWYTDSHMVHLFIHLVFSANVKDKRWRGIEVKRGQFVTGRKVLAQDTGISEQSVRTCLARMVETGEVTIKSTSKFSIITVCKYEEYQENKKEINQQTNQQLTNNQPAANQQLTTTKEVKECKEVVKTYSAIDFLAGLGARENLIKDWFAVRKTKRTPNTETAMTRFVGEVAKSGIEINEVLTTCCERGWAGFKASWIADKRISANDSNQPMSQMAKGLAVFEEVERRLGDGGMDSDGSEQWIETPLLTAP